MKSPFLNNAKAIVFLSCIAASMRATQAADFEEPDTTGWFVRADAVARFNVKASLHAANPVLPGGYYNDGFVAPDNGGTASGKTWNWGYNAASQINGSDLTAHRYDSVPVVGDHDLNAGNPVLGGEIIGGYQFTGFKFLNRPARAGFELGYGYSRLSQSMGFGATGASVYTVDSYSLNGIVPPLAPYAGTAAGPGPLIDLNNNSRSVVSSAASTALQGSLQTTFQNLRIGPSFDIDLTKRLSAGVSLGYSSVYVDGTLNYAETTSFANPAVPTLNSGPVTLNSSDWEPGVYLEMRANYQFTRYVGAFLGADWQYNKALQFGDSSHQIKIDLGSTYAAKAGLLVRF